METQQTPTPPTTAVHFSQAKGEPPVDRVIFALKGICEAVDRQELHVRDWDGLCRMVNLAAAAAILADQLHDRLASQPNPARRRNPALRAVPAGAPGGTP